MAALYTETITGMTTIFTPPASCSRSWTFEGSAYNSVPGGILMQNLNEDGFDTACFPSEFDMYGRAPSLIQVYSPGWCPKGYGTPGVQSFDGTTTLTCCPSSFSYGSTYSSINNFGSSSVLFMGCISFFSGSTVVPARSGDSDLSSHTILATGEPVTMWAQPITMEYRKRDVSLFVTTSSTLTTRSTSTRTRSTTAATKTTGTTTTTTTRSHRTSSTTPSPTQTGSSSLSTGAKAGIGVGIALGVLLLIAALVAFIVVKRRRARGGKLPPGYDDKKDPSKLGVSELPQNEPARSELVGNQEFPRRELDATETQSDRQRRYELE